MKAGDKFGWLVAIENVAGKRWLCKCLCGNEKIFGEYDLLSGHDKSCGCGKNSRTIKHKSSNERIYRIWAAMRCRCRNPNNCEYKFYGGKNITVCEQWDDFITFREWANNNGYSDELTIDRIDNDKGYFPDNCRWITREEQNRNTSRTHRIKDGDRTLTASQVGEIINVSRSQVAKWARNGEIKTLQDAINKEKTITDIKHLRKKGE